MVLLADAETCKVSASAGVSYEEGSETSIQIYGGATSL